MGMFDDIIVPKSYLRGLLDKEYEKCLETNHSFQTKDLENLLDIYKVYRQNLYFKEYPQLGDGLGEEKKKKQEDKWKKLTKTITINFYDSVQNERGDNIWIEFDFSFVDGRLDKKKLIKAEISETKEQREAKSKMWRIENEIYSRYRSKLRIRFLNWLSRCLQNPQRWLSAQCRLIPESVRKEAYKASGRKGIRPR